MIMSEDNKDIYGLYCKHDYQIIDPKKRLEECIKCHKVRSFPRYPYTLREIIKEEKKQRDEVITYGENEQVKK